MTVGLPSSSTSSTAATCRPMAGFLALIRDYLHRLRGENGSREHRWIENRRVIRNRRIEGAEHDGTAGQPDERESSAIGCISAGTIVLAAIF